jgi:uncharacterized protein (TIGR03437 family)
MMYFIKKLFPAILLFSLLTAGAAVAQTISLVSGDGQVVTQNNVTLNNLTVVVKNLQGQPVSGATVTWAVNGQGSLTGGATSTTAADGTSFNQFLGPTLFNVSFVQSAVSASAFGSTVNFTVTTSGLDPTAANAAVVQAQLIYPTPGITLTGASGSVGTTAVQTQVFSNGISGYKGIQNVLVRLIPSNTTSGPQIACSGTTGYSTANGYSSCLPVFSGPTGTGNYTVDVGGGYRQFGPFPFSVTQGSVASIVVTSGNNQSGAPGTTLPLPLAVRTQDTQGNPLPNVPLTWQAVPANGATINNAATVSDSSGNATAQVVLGSTPGPVQITVSSSQGGTQATFNLQINLQVTGINKLAGDNQTAITNTAFAQPLVVQVNSSQGSAAGVQVRFTSTGAGVTFANGGLATTDSTGRASITVQAGASAGATVVTASVSSYTATFALTIQPPGPQVTLSSFFNGAGGQAGGVSPSAVLSIYGVGIAPGLQGCVAGNQVIGPLPILVSNVTVLFSESGYQAYAPIYSVCNLGVGQEYVTVQVPTDLPLGAASVTVGANSGSTTVNNVPVTPVSPGIFQTVMSDKVLRAVLQHADGSYVSLESPAHAGETLLSFVTGLGRPISASGVAIGSDQGGIPGDNASPQSPLIIGVADEGVPVISAVYAPNLVGVWILTFKVPADAPTGNNVNFAVAVVLNDSPVYGNPSKIPVQ